MLFIPFTISLDGVCCKKKMQLKISWVCWVEDGVSDSKGVLENMPQAHDPSPNKQPFLGGGFNIFFCSPLLGEMIQFD